jgi:hypothetical protein
MPLLFAVPLQGLTLGILRDFLDAAEPEPLIWEAKGTKLDPHEIRRQCGGFANSERGGFLILGASGGPSTGWSCDGFEFPDGDPHRYISSSLAEGVRPMPHYDVRSLPVGSDRHLAVVEVQPLHAGPAIVRGTVYERIPGATIPVKDPARLAALFARGQHAHSAARTSAERMLSVALEPLRRLEEHEDDQGPDVALVSIVAIGAVAPGPDVSSRLFTDQLRDLLGEVVTGAAETAPPLRPILEQAVAQDRRVALAVAARELWDGAVGVATRQPGDVSPDRVIQRALEPGWQAARRVADGLQLDGDVYVVMTAGHPQWWPNLARVDRGPLALTDGPDWPSVGRELSRAAGIDVAEPA